MDSSPKTPKVFPIAFLTSSLVLVIAGYFVSGWVAATGAFLGVVGIGISMVGTWIGIGWIGKLMKDGSPKWQGSAVPISMMVIKLPVILVSMSWALRLGPPAPVWFLGGLALVYSGTVWWSFLRK